MNYQAIIFDLFGTLVESPTVSQRAIVLKNVASAFSVPVKDFSKVWHDTSNERDTGTFGDLRHSIQHICRQLGVSPTEPQIELAISLRLKWFKDLLQPVQETIAVLTTLRERSYRIGLISDCSAEVPMVWDKTPLASLIDAAIFSCSVGIKKPDSHIYQIVTERLEVQPGKCLYVGDGGSRELSGALNAGMDAIMFTANRSNQDAYVIDPEDWRGTAILSIEELLKLA